MPFTSIFSMVWTQKPRCGAILSRSSAFPAPFLPKDRSSPAATNRVFICLARISVAKRSGSVAAVSFVRGNSIRVSIPRRSNRRLFSSLVVSSLPSDRPNSTAGVGSKVNTHAASPYFFRPRISSKSLLWPRWTPSNLPMATAVSFSR